jgi:urease subunit gamma/beta
MGAMHLTPREQERLLIAAAADLARRRLARGARLGATEAVALVCDEICEWAWDGVHLAEVIERARAVIPAGALLPGAGALVPVLEVEALFPWGSTLVHVDAPFGRYEDQSRPERTAATRAHAHDQDPAGGADPAAAVPVDARRGQVRPGEVRAADGTIALAPGAPRRTVVLRNTGHRDVWISSHFPLDQVNPAIEIWFAGDSESGTVPHPDADGGTTPSGDAAAGPLTGCRLDLPAGESLLLRPGERSAHLAVIRSNRGAAR